MLAKAAGGRDGDKPCEAAGTGRFWRFGRSFVQLACRMQRPGTQLARARTMNALAAPCVIVRAAAPASQRARVAAPRAALPARSTRAALLARRVWPCPRMYNSRAEQYF